MAYNPLTIGQQPMSSSQGVVIASNQSPVSVTGTLNITGNPSISGQVGVSIIGQLPAGTASLGSVTALQGTLPWAIAGSVAAIIPGVVNTAGSVVAFQGTNPWIETFSNSSIIAINAGSVVAVSQGSVITVSQGSIAAAQIGTQITSIAGTVVIQSIVGTYIEDNASANADPGIFVLGVRNDTMSSLVSASGDYGAFAQDSQGRQVIKPFSPNESEFTYTGSVVSTSVTLILASVIGKRGYITDFFVSNTGAATTLVTFQDGSTSVMGYTIAPTTGGSNAPGIAIPLKSAPSQDVAFKATTATSILFLTVKGYQAP